MPLLLLLSLLLFCPLAGQAEEFNLAPQLLLQLDAPGTDWQFRREPPPFLILETVEHVRHHLTEEGKEVPANLPDLVRERLGQNELFLVRPQTLARLQVDFSPDPEGTPAPSPQTVEQSARFAAAELENESDLTEVRTRVAPGSLAGAGTVWLVEASYLQDGESRRFFGVIGYAGGGWLFLYYTDSNRDPDDLEAVRRVLAGARIAGG